MRKEGHGFEREQRGTGKLFTFLPFHGISEPIIVVKNQICFAGQSLNPMATFQVAEHTRRTERSHSERRKVITEAPKHRTRDTRSCKEKQVLTLRCELVPENPSNWYLCL